MAKKSTGAISVHYRAVGAEIHPYVGRSVDSISTRVADYANLITNNPPGFSGLPTALHYSRPVASGGARGACAPPLFDQSVNPISTRGSTLSPPSTMCPPGFSDLATALSNRLKRIRV